MKDEKTLVAHDTLLSYSDSCYYRGAGYGDITRILEYSPTFSPVPAKPYCINVGYETR